MSQEYSMNYYFTILTLLLGWLLGIFSTLIIDVIRKSHQKTNFKKALFTEFKEIRLRLAGGIYLISGSLGTIDKNLLQWCYNILENHSEKITAETLKKIKRQLRLSDKKIRALYQPEPNLTKNPYILKKFHLSFLESNLTYLSLFNLTFQSRVIEIKNQLDLVNEDIELNRFYYEKTFDSSLNESDRRIVDNNVISQYQNLIRSFRFITDKITNLIEERG
jgi:hypothetical protein